MIKAAAESGNPGCHGNLRDFTGHLKPAYTFGEAAQRALPAFQPASASCGPFA
jgi:hypothetical protein